MYKRKIDVFIKSHFQKMNLMLLLYGARQVGKTTLLQRIFPNAVFLLVDNESIRQKLEEYDIYQYQEWLPKNTKQILIDEIHLLSNPGRAAKIIFDHMTKTQIIISGSSSLHIKNQASESMAGRFVSYQLFPLTFEEYVEQKDYRKSHKTDIIDRILLQKKEPLNKPLLFLKNDVLSNVLLFGGYPQLIKTPANIKYLKEYVETMLFKDIIELNLIDNRVAAKLLLKLLAHQIGNLIDYTELSRRVGVDQRTVRRYIEIFEESYILYRLYPFSKRERNVITRTPKIYFYDLGVRNAIIDNFSPIQQRGDMGAMFENFIISEFIKANAYKQDRYHFYYWRPKIGAEVDLVLTKDDKITGIEIKYQKLGESRAFRNRYKEAAFFQVTKDNFY